MRFSRTARGLLALVVGAGCLALSAAASGREVGIKEIENQFRTLPMESRRLTGPLFWLHGDESKGLLESYVGKVAEGGNGTFTAESRPHNDWLGEGWWRDLSICLDAAKRNDLTMWIFDEKWWPSGEVANRVPPQFGSKYMQAQAIEAGGRQSVKVEGCDSKLIAVIAGKLVDGQIDGASLIDLTPMVAKGEINWTAPSGSWKVMKFTWDYWKGPRPLVDGASADSVDWYIKTVYQPHYDHYKADFGKTIQGFFYDEPETHGDWGTEVIKVLTERKVDWKKALVAWKFALGGDEQAAAKYQYQDAYAEAWGRTFYGGLSKWCGERGVTSIGHWLEHGYEYLNPALCAGNMFQVQKYSDMGGIDLVCRQMYPGTRPASIYQTPKLGSSITHMYGKTDDITMCEMFGAYGQDITYPQMKWLTDQMQVRGVNFMIPHSFNPKSPKDTDCPPYFYNGGAEPRWPLYKVYADYTSRLSLMLSGGRHVCPVALLFVGNSAHVGKYVTPEQMTGALQDALFDCDWMPYDVFEKDTKLTSRELTLRQERFKVLVVPPVEVIPYATLAKVKRFFDAGGVVVGYGFLPTKSATLGKSSAAIAALRSAVWGDAQPGLGVCKKNAAGGRSYLLPEAPSPDDIRNALTVDAGIHPTLEVAAGETNNWLHVLHRVKSGRDVFLVCNQNADAYPRAFTLRVTAVGEPECWDAMRGEVTSVPYRRIAPDKVEIDMALEPMESALLVFQAEKRPLMRRQDAGVTEDTKCTMISGGKVDTPQAGMPDRSPSALDGCAWMWFGEGNPAAAAPPGTRYFRGSVTIPADKQIKQAVFTISADNELTLLVNGKEAGKTSGGYAWKSPAKLDVTSLLVPGKNSFAVSATNLNDTPNPAGLIGSCSIEYGDASVQTVRIDEQWKAANERVEGWEQPAFDDSSWQAAAKVVSYGGQPWGLLGPDHLWTFSPVTGETFEGKCLWHAGLDPKWRIYLEMDGLSGEEAAVVSVNGKDAGGFIGKPFRLDVSEYIIDGENTFRIWPFVPKSAWLRICPIDGG